MRFTTAVTFARFIGACGVGSYLGAATAGLVALLSGKAFEPGSPWLAGVPFLAVIGALVTAVAFRLTRYWLLPKLRRRLLWGALAGAVLTPFAVAVGQLGDLRPLAAWLMLAGALPTGWLWARWFRGSRSTSRRAVPARQAS
ncbi:hypothetical protein AB0A63_13870 [Lentzea sp. NPDC042327]|uniref:hypothetical protein n=1 Tax=Lentzea sp. NPDC042327 TaxID=3154801 RepID=UPI0033D15EC2